MKTDTREAFTRCSPRSPASFRRYLQLISSSAASWFARTMGDRAEECCVALLVLMRLHEVNGEWVWQLIYSPNHRVQGEALVNRGAKSRSTWQTYDWGTLKTRLLLRYYSLRGITQMIFWDFCLVPLASWQQHQDRLSRGMDFGSQPVKWVVLMDWPRDATEYIRRVPWRKIGWNCWKMNSPDTFPVSNLEPRWVELLVLVQGEVCGTWYNWAIELLPACRKQEARLSCKYDSC